MKKNKLKSENYRFTCGKLENNQSAVSTAVFSSISSIANFDIKNLKKIRYEKISDKSESAFFGGQSLLSTLVCESFSSILPKVDKILPSNGIPQFLSPAQRSLNLQLLDSIQENNNLQVETLISSKADVNTVDSIGNTALSCAASLGFTEIVKSLIKNKANTNIANINSSINLLRSGIQNEYKEEIIRLLLESEININDYNNNLGMLDAVCNDENIDIIKLLINKGIDINITNENGTTPLMKAAESGSKEISKLLLTYSADIDKRDKNGKKAINYGLNIGNKLKNNNQQEIVRSLSSEQLRRSAELASCQYKLVSKIIEIPDMPLIDNIPTLISQYALGNYEDIIKLEENSIPSCIDITLLSAVKNADKDQVKKLLALGANVNRYPSLKQAAIRGYKNIVKLLINAKANVNANYGNSSKTALISATQKGYKDIVKLLVKNNADVDYTNDSQKTALIYAIEQGYKNITKLLINFKANVNFNCNGRSALHSALAFNDIFKLLIESGADINYPGLDKISLFSEAAKNDEIINRLIGLGVKLNLNLIDQKPIYNIPEKDRNGLLEIDRKIRSEFERQRDEIINSQNSIAEKIAEIYKLKLIPQIIAGYVIGTYDDVVNFKKISAIEALSSKRNLLEYLNPEHQSKSSDSLSAEMGSISKRKGSSSKKTPKTKIKIERTPALSNTSYSINYSIINKNKDAFNIWCDNLPEKIRNVILSRIDRLKTGDFGDFKKVRSSGIMELRFALGYRIYIGIFANEIYLLNMGTKSSQELDIVAAEKNWANVKEAQIKK